MNSLAVSSQRVLSRSEGKLNICKPSKERVRTCEDYVIGLILGSFYYGYIVTQLPGGWLGSQFGGKYLFGFGVLLTSVVTMFTPAAAHHSVGMLLLVRVVEGFGQVNVVVIFFQSW